MNCIRNGLLSLFILLMPAIGHASELPDVLVETTITELVNELEQRRAELEQDKQKLYKMVEDVVVPHFDIDLIARLVLGKHWRGATESQRTTFAEEFKQLMIRTYATALFEYTGNEKMEVTPVRLKDGDEKTTVKTKVILPGAPAVPVNYSFILNKTGEWKIYDVKIDGISLVTTYRSSYSQMVQSKGLDVLIAELKKKNVTLESS